MIYKLPKGCKIGNRQMTIATYIYNYSCLLDMPTCEKAQLVGNNTESQVNTVWILPLVSFIDVITIPRQLLHPW